MTRNWVAIQRNLISGRGQRRRELLLLCEELRRLGFAPRLYTDREKLRRHMQQPDRRERLHCIVAAGGDGTIADVINRYPDVPVTTLPLGNENLLARYWDLPRDGRQLARIIADGHRQSVDLGEWNGRRFTLMCGIGFDGAVVHHTHADRRGPVRRRHYLAAIARSWLAYPHPLQELRLDGGPPLVAANAIIVNTPAYAMRLQFAPRADPCDGQLDVCVFLRHRRRDVLRDLARAAFGQLARDPHARLIRARNVTVAPAACDGGPAPVQLDGDPAGTTGGTCRVLPGALTLIVPRPRRSSGDSHTAGNP